MPVKSWEDIKAEVGHEDWVMRYPDVKHASGLSRSSIYDAEREGRFPRRIQLSPTTCGWLASEVYAWIRDRAAQRKPPPEKKPKAARGRRARRADRVDA